MGLTLKEPERKLLPAGTFQAKCYTIADIGSQPNKFKGGELKSELVIIWELSESMDDGRPYAISQTYTASLGEKSNIRRDLEAWRGRPFTDEELRGFSLKKVIGKDCFLSVIHEERNGRMYSKVGSVIALPKGVPPLPTNNEPVFFDMDEFDPDAFEKLPQWIQERVKKSPEWAFHMSQGEEIAPEDVNSDVDSIPY